MKRILVPTDFSKIAGNALKYAANLAKRYKAEIIVLYMIHREDAFLSRKEAMDLYQDIDYHKRIEEKFEEFLDHDFLTDINILTEIRRKVDFYKMASLTQELEVDLIVMGSHGAHGLQGMFIGSNTEKVIRSSNVPVLVIKDMMPGFRFEKVVIACDLNLDMTEAFKKAYKFLRNLNLDFKILYVNTPEDFLSTRLMEKEVDKFFHELEMDKSEFEDKIIFYNDFNIEAGIFTYARHEDTDLLVLLTHGRKGLAHIIYQSYGEKIANHSDIPILTVRT